MIHRILFGALVVGGTAAPVVAYGAGKGKDEEAIPYDVCGKVIVAVNNEELPGLEELRRRGEANGLTGLRMISPEELCEIEPHAKGVRGPPDDALPR